MYLCHLQKYFLPSGHFDLSPRLFHQNYFNQDLRSENVKNGLHQAKCIPAELKACKSFMKSSMSMMRALFSRN